jgi:hypothetical protein
MAENRARQRRRGDLSQSRATLAKQARHRRSRIDHALAVAGGEARPYLDAMRMSYRPALLGALLLCPILAQAQQERPKKLGEFQSWIAATYTEGGQKICYAFTRAGRSEGANRQNVMMTVTHRPNARDTVTISAGYTYPRTVTDVQVTVGSHELPFYTAGTTAAARDNAAAIRAMRGGRDAVAKAPGPNGRGQVTDTFPLAGFSAAYDAISRECPARR